MDCKDTPATVRKAFDETYPTAAMKACTEELYNGQTAYEIVSTDGDTARDVIFSADGKLIVAEVTIPTSDLPELVHRRRFERGDQAEEMPVDTGCPFLSIVNHVGLLRPESVRRLSRSLRRASLTVNSKAPTRGRRARPDGRGSVAARSHSGVAVAARCDRTRTPATPMRTRAATLDGTRSRVLHSVVYLSMIIFRLNT